MAADSKTNLLARIERYKKRIDHEKATRKLIIVNMQDEQLKLRAHYASIVTKHVNAERNLEERVSQLTTAAIQDHFKIQELENQVAVQYKDNAGFGQDVQQLTESAEKLRRYWRETQRKYEAEQLRADNLQIELDCALKSIQYRLWCSVEQLYRDCKFGIAMAKERIVNRWMIRRLSKQRVEALHAAGHVPEKLVKLALDYYEHDKSRMGYQETVMVGDHLVEIPNTLWRKLMILLGRA